MKTERNILIAFILNLAFSLFEFIGGFFTEIVQKKRHRVKDVVFALQISTYILDSAPFFLLFGN